MIYVLHMWIWFSWKYIDFIPGESLNIQWQLIETEHKERGSGEVNWEKSFIPGESLDIQWQLVDTEHKERCSGEVG